MSARYPCCFSPRDSNTGFEVKQKTCMEIYLVVPTPFCSASAAAVQRTGPQPGMEYRGTLLIREVLPVGTYSSPRPRANLGWSATCASDVNLPHAKVNLPDVDKGLLFHA